MNDKVKHILAGLLIAAWCGIPAYVEGSLFAGIWSAVCGGVTAGMVKEWCDNHYAWEWDWKDLLATCVGVLIAVLFIVALHFGKG